MTAYLKGITTAKRTLFTQNKYNLKCIALNKFLHSCDTNSISYNLISYSHRSYNCNPVLQAEQVERMPQVAEVFGDMFWKLGRNKKQEDRLENDCQC